MKKLFAMLVLAVAVVGLVPVKPADAQPIYGVYCCDGGGNRRCILSSPAPVGLGCWCNGQGAGFVCL